MRRNFINPRKKKIALIGREETRKEERGKRIEKRGKTDRAALDLILWSLCKHFSNVGDAGTAWPPTRCPRRFAYSALCKLDEARMVGLFMELLREGCV